MAAKTSQHVINLSFNQIIVAFAAVMVAAGAFVAIITNVVVGSRVGALEATLAAQYNPVNVTAAEQTNNPPLCVDNSMAGGEVAGASTGEGAVLGASTGALGYGVAKGKYLPLLGNYSQSNSSVITTTSTNYYTDNRWSGNTWSYSNSSTNGSYNSWTSSNTNNQAWNNGNTNDSGNTTTNTTNNNQAWNNGNDNSNHQSSTTTNTTTNTSVNVSNNGNTNDSGNTNNQTWNQNNNSTNNSGNTSSTSTTTNTSQNNGNTTNSGNSQDNDTVNIVDNDLLDVL